MSLQNSARDSKSPYSTVGSGLNDHRPQIGFKRDQMSVTDRAWKGAIDEERNSRVHLSCFIAETMRHVRRIAHCNCVGESTSRVIGTIIASADSSTTFDNKVMLQKS